MVELHRDLRNLSEHCCSVFRPRYFEGFQNNVSTGVLYRFRHLRFQLVTVLGLDSMIIHEHEKLTVDGN